MRRREKKLETTAMSTTESTVASTAAAGLSLADHDLTVMGTANITRRFDLDEPTNGPSIIWRTVFPYLGLIQGFSATDPDGISSGDTTAATDTTVTDPTTDLYPITPMATIMLEDVWPVIANLLASGTGNRSTVSDSEWVRYNAMLFQSYLLLMGVKQINNLTYHFDWSKVYPFTDMTPSYLYDLAATFDATDVGLAETWLPLMKRFETKIAFPRMVQEFKRMLAPMLSVDFNARIQVPMPFDINDENNTSAALQARVIELLDYLDGPLAATGAVLTSFLPFPMSFSAPFDLPIQPIIDLDRDTGWWNSGCMNFAAFGDTTDPSTSDSLTFYNASGGEYNQVVWYTRHTQPVWAELKTATIWKRDYDVVDDVFRMISLHHMGNILIPDDAGDVFRFDGASIASSSVGYKYIDFANSRYTQNFEPWGVMKPGFLGAEFGLSSFLRLLRIDTNYGFSLQTLKEITQEMTGGSLRELRAALQVQIGQSVRSPY
jgi:hypothetical protein